MECIQTFWHILPWTVTGFVAGVILTIIILKDL